MSEEEARAYINSLPLKEKKQLLEILWSIAEETHPKEAAGI